MKLLESFVRGKFNDPDRCEDCIVSTDDFIAVIDGVTTKSDRLYDGKKSGRMAAELLCTAMHAMPQDLAAEELFNRLNQVIHGFCSEHDAHGNEIPRASIIVYNHQNHEILQYGDCQYRMNGITVHQESRIDQMNGMLRQYTLEKELMEGNTVEALLNNDLGRLAIQKNLKDQYLFENMDSAFGYPVLNGSPINPGMIKRTAVQKGTTVILASDGYPELFDTLQETEEHLQKTIQEDPLCFQLQSLTKAVYPGQCSYDDRSYIRFTD